MRSQQFSQSTGGVSSATLGEELVERLHRLLHTLRNQCRNGWDINVMQQLHAEFGLLAGQCNRDGQIELGEQFLALETALGPALTRGRTPDAGTTALVAALGDHLRGLIPRSVQAPPGADESVVPIDDEAAQGADSEHRVLIASMRADVVTHIATALSADSGFVTRAVQEPLAVLEELSRFAPDCVLIDLHMAVCDGPELAGMIHERPDFADLPVLFLADGETSTDAPQDVIDTGMPDAELATVLRQRIADGLLQRHASADLGRRRGQYRRAWLLDRLDACLVNGGAPRGGLLDISIDRVTVLHRHLGMNTLMLMHEQLGSLLAEALEAGDMLAESGAGYLLLSRERSREGMYALAEELRQMVSRERFGPAALPLSVTIGGCALNGSLDAVDAVLSAAQRARHNAVPGQIGWHHHGAGTVDPLQLETALRNDRLHLVYQAIVNISGAPLPQYQALLRLRDNEGYVHTAAELLPVARRAGLTPAVDRWSLDRCLQLLAEYQRQTRPLRLFVSQSSESLQERDYPTWLASRLQAHGVRGARLVLEFRCDDISSAPRELLRSAPRIKALGVGLCLSGVDRSLHAAQLLDALSLDYIKLVPSLATSPGALLPIAHARNISVIVPQVEDSTLIHHLRGLGVDCVQGNSLAHPARALNYAFDTAATG
jgi:EAL domain-containing protein (putative c-di-GMP-specific phosphodiesterase class I)/CheY-like chemotaxis protein